MSWMPEDSFYPPRLLVQLTSMPVPIMWGAHTPRDQALFLEELDLWVGWLVDRYGLDQRVVPGCWAEHPELIEELSALHLAWETAFSSSANADEPLRWHERFDVARSRLSDWVTRTGCRPGAHRAR
jgi:hypothetical protein